MNADITDAKLAPQGKNRIEWAEQEMPVLRAIRERFQKERPLEGMRIAACLHVTSETANLARTLAAGGAHVLLCASNPLSTQDSVAASIAVDYGLEVHARRGEDRDTYYKHLNSCLDIRPTLTLDDGADLVSLVHSERRDLAEGLLAGMEETTTGVIRLRAMQQEGALLYPIVAVNDADTKYLFDNRYGTGQSTVDGILRATNILLSGRKVVALGYGWCGRGFAMRMRGMGARVIVTEVNPIRALEASMDGYEVMTAAEAARVGDLFCTLTGNKHVLRREHFEQMKDGAIVCNSGHFNVELDLEALEAMATEVKREVRPHVDEYRLPDGRSLFVLAQGRLVNLSAAEGHPAAVMDMSFATQALMAEYMRQHHEDCEPVVLDVPQEVEKWIATLKLQTLGLSIDKLTPEQEAYLQSWHEGT